MRAAAVSALEFGVSEEAVRAAERGIPTKSVIHEDTEWSRDAFAEEQVRGLVRQLFSPTLRPPVQQVVFSSVEGETDVRGLCTWVAEVAAEEKSVEVALIDESENCWKQLTDGRTGLETGRDHRSSVIRQFATMVRNNVWTFPSWRAYGGPRQLSLRTYLSEIRKVFECSIVAAPAGAMSSKALEMAKFADGIVLVLSAERTRRVTALKVRNTLSEVRLLGTVLMDREFPIPASIYRRL